MKKYNYNNLTQKYELLTERYFEEVGKDKLKEGCWDEKRNHPIQECLNEDGTLKAECRKDYMASGVTVPENTDGTEGTPGNIEALDGYAGPQLNEEAKHLELLKGHLNNLEEAVGKWSHHAAPMVHELVQDLKEIVNECGLGNY